jgi:hypothetical protein
MYKMNGPFRGTPPRQQYSPQGPQPYRRRPGRGPQNEPPFYREPWQR